MSSVKPGLVWSPEWFHRHESLWSIVGKLAHVNVVGLPQLRGILRAARTVGSYWRPAPAHHAHELLGALGIPVETGRTAFLWDIAPGDADLAQTSATIRYCRSCASDAFHSVLFQHLATHRCPVHNEPLVDYCSRCGHPFVPQVEHPWRCGRCDHSLVEPQGYDWLRRFRAGPANDALDRWRDALRARLECAAGSRDDRHIVLSFSTPVHAEDFMHWSPFVQQLRLARWFGDEWAHLMSTVLAHHRGCCEAALIASASRDAAAPAKACTVGWALVHAAQYAGVPWELDRWKVFTPQMGKGIARLLLPGLFDPGCGKYLDEPAAGLIARAEVRALVADALAAHVGRAGATPWMPWHREKPRFEVCWTAAKRGDDWQLTIQTSADLATLERLAEPARHPA